MYAVEFETDIKSEYIKVPEYNKLKNKHAKILFLLKEADFELPEEKVTTTQQLFREFILKRDNNPIEISKDIDLLQLENEVNNDIF